MALTTDLERKICFYNATPLMRRDYERFGFETFLTRGYRVTFLDMTRVINPDYLTRYEPPDLSDYKDVVVAEQREDILNFVRDTRRAFAIPFYGYSETTRFLYEAFKTYDVQYAYPGSIPLPGDSQPGAKGQVRRLAEESRNLHFAHIARALPRNILALLRRPAASISRFAGEYLAPVQAPRYVLRPTPNISDIGPKWYKRGETIEAHVLDYDLYLKYRGGPSPLSYPYCVFLDEYFPIHPDFYTSNATHPGIRIDEYYAGLNRYFDLFEQRKGVPVVVAAHPRARYDLHRDYFNRRKVETGKTAELVAHAEVVIAHHSTAIGFAVMHHRPLIFLTSDDIENTLYSYRIARMAASFGKRAINVDHNIELDIDRELVVDQQKYKRFMRNYVKAPGTPEKPFWEIVADKIDIDYFGGAREPATR